MENDSKPSYLLFFSKTHNYKNKIWRLKLFLRTSSNAEFPVKIFRSKSRNFKRWIDNTKFEEWGYKCDSQNFYGGKIKNNEGTNYVKF